MHEAEAAVQLENTLGGKLERVDVPKVGNQAKEPDFIFADGPNARSLPAISCPR